jgi:glucose repression mediator protein
LLEAAVTASPNDPEPMLYLAEIYRNHDQNDRAQPLYERAMRLDPSQVTASVGLGGIHFVRGEYGEAIRLWQDALAKNAGLVLVGINLAVAQSRTGDPSGARATVGNIIDLSPGFAPARELLKRLRP